MFDVCHSEGTRQTLFSGKKILYNFCRVPTLAHGKSLPCATHGKPCRQTVPHRFTPSVTFFCRVSKLTHGKTSPCTHNLAVSKGKVYRGRICHVFFVVSNIRQSLRCVRFGLSRVPQAHGKPPNPVVLLVCIWWWNLLLSYCSLERSLVLWNQIHSNPFKPKIINFFLFINMYIWLNLSPFHLASFTWPGFLSPLTPPSRQPRLPPWPIKSPCQL